MYTKSYIIKHRPRDNYSLRGLDADGGDRVVTGRIVLDADGEDRVANGRIFQGAVDVSLDVRNISEPSEKFIAYKYLIVKSINK